MPVSIKSNGTYGSLLVNGSESVRFGSDNSGQLSSFRNKLINGGFELWQRATSAAITTSWTYPAVDRWAIVQEGASNSTVSLASSFYTGVSAGLKIQRTNGATGIGAIHVAQVLEICEVVPLQGKTVTLSFLSKVGANYSGGTLIVQLATSTNGTQLGATTVGGWSPQTFAINTTVTPTTSMQKFALTTTIPINAINLFVQFIFIPTGTAGADDSVYIGNVQLEEGSIATPFERRPIGLEIALCQRFYEPVNLFVIGNAVGAGAFVGALQTYNTKRVAPTWTAINVIESVNCAGININNTGVSSARVYATSTAVGNLYYTASYKLDAELY